MGSPTHNINLPKVVRPVFDGLPKKLRKLGGKSIIRPETFHVQGREGLLYDGEIGRARTWATVILERIDKSGYLQCR